MSSNPESLRLMLADQLEPKLVEAVIKTLEYEKTHSAVESLLKELGDLSLKIQGAGIKSMGELSRRNALSYVVTWLDLGITLTQASGALGLRYFKESPGILGFWGAPVRSKQLLGLILELADSPIESAPHCAYEFFKVVAQFSGEVSLAELRQWADLGFELAELNYILGNEFFRESPKIHRAIPLDVAKAWIALGMKLIVRNSLGKPDYVGTLEYFRSSPGLFQEIAGDEAKERVLALGNSLAAHSPEHAVGFLAVAPQVLAGLPSEEWKNRVLKFGVLIADRDAEAAGAYFQRASEVIHFSRAGETSVFEAWFAQGMEALEYSIEAGRAFFNLETRQACLAVEEVMTGVPLRKVLRSLKMFARALSGEDVSIQGQTEAHGSPDASQTIPVGGEGDKASVTDHGKTIYLPRVMRRSSTPEGNLRWYVAMVAHEVGHLEFGTYRLSSTVLEEVALSVDRRAEQRAPEVSSSVKTLGDVFRRYPQPALIRDLWEILEDARVEFLLKQEYPGLREDFSALTKEAITLRSLAHGMTAREIVLDALLLKFSGLDQDVVSAPELQAVIDPIWDEARTILQPLATVNDSVKLADRLYQELERRIGQWNPSAETHEPFPGDSGEEHAGVAHEATEQFEEDYTSFDNWGYRSALDPHSLAGNKDDQESQEDAVGQKTQGASRGGSAAGRGGQNEAPSRFEQSGEKREPSAQFGESPLQQWFHPNPDTVGGPGGKPLGGGRFIYPEWDGNLRDYRPQWCRVTEQQAGEGSPDFVDETLRTYGAVVKMIRRYFECIRPEAFRRVGKQSEGEDIDCDAMVNWLVDRKRGAYPSDQIYASRQKRDRQVAVAFVIDMSGSTGRQLGAGGRTVNEIEKEGLFLLSEALSAVGDQFAIYGFSGKSRHLVDLQIIKDFTQRPGGRVGLKISGVKPRQQNRDGAAIRHATFRLLEQAAKVRLLVLLSDGKPLDDDYTEEYALEDTQKALREARLKGIHPFCITIDQAASDYVKRMYGEVGYLVIDEIDSLPIRLPKIYQRLTAQ